MKFPVCIVFGPSQSAHCTKTGFVVNCLVCTCSMFASQAPCHQYLSSASVVRHWYVLSGRTFQMAQLAQLGVVSVCKVCIVTRMISVQIWLPAEPGCCLHEDFDRHPIYVELYHEVKQNEDLERHRSMSKKVSFPTSTWKTKVSLSSVFLQLSMSSSCAISHFKAACRHSFRHEMT